jgi:oxalate decarboxylase
MALTPHALVQAHTKLDRAAIDALPQTKSPVVPG